MSEIDKNTRLRYAAISTVELVLLIGMFGVGLYAGQEVKASTATFGIPFLPSVAFMIVVITFTVIGAIASELAGGYLGARSVRTNE